MTPSEDEPTVWTGNECACTVCGLETCEDPSHKPSDDNTSPQSADGSKPKNPFAPPAYWQLLDVANIREWDCPDLRWIIEGIIARGNLVWVAAESQVGKTLLGLYIAEQMLRGGRLFDKFAITPVKRVLYLALEDPPRRIKARILDMLREGDPPLEPGQFMVYVVPGLRINDDLAFLWLEQFLTREKFDVVFLDTYQKATPGVTSFDDEKQSLMIHGLADLTRRLDVALWVNDHFRKAQDGKRRELTKDAIKGTVGKQVNADCIVLMERAASDRIAVSVESKETGTKFGFLLEVTAEGDTTRPKFTHVGDFDVLASKSKAKGQKTRNAIIKAMLDTEWISSGDLAKHLKLDRTTVTRQLNSLVHKKIVESEGEGKLTRYRISEASQKTDKMHQTGEFSKLRYLIDACAKCVGEKTLQKKCPWARLGSSPWTLVMRVRRSPVGVHRKKCLGRLRPGRWNGSKPTAAIQRRTADFPRIPSGKPKEKTMKLNEQVNRIPWSNVAKTRSLFVSLMEKRETGLSPEEATVLNEIIFRSSAEGCYEDEPEPEPAAEEDRAMSGRFRNPHARNRWGEEEPDSNLAGFRAEPGSPLAIANERARARLEEMAGWLRWKGIAQDLDAWE